MTAPFHYDTWGFSLALFPSDTPENVYKNQYWSSAMLKSFLAPNSISLQAYFYLLYSPTYLAVIPDICFSAVDDYLKDRFSHKNKKMVTAALNQAEPDSQFLIEELTEEQTEIAVNKMSTGILLNHTTKQFVNLRETYSQLDCLVMLAMCFDPDLLETQSIIATNATVGEWAFDLLEVTDTIPDGYKEFKPSFALKEK